MKRERLFSPCQTTNIDSLITICRRQDFQKNKTKNNSICRYCLKPRAKGTESKMCSINRIFLSMSMLTCTPYTEYNIGKFYLEIIPNKTSMLLGVRCKRRHRHRQEIPITNTCKCRTIQIPCTFHLCFENMNCNNIVSITFTV